MRRIAVLLWFFCAPLWAGPACIDPGGGGIGGTGVKQAEGVGGTGARVAGDGVGGTGAPLAGGVGGTGGRFTSGTRIGIVGAITGFGSVCVNGLRVHYTPDTPVSENGRPASVATLALGQFVSIDVDVGADGDLSARDMSVVHLMEGPLTAVDADGFEVMGQRLVLLPDVRIVTEGRAFKVGDKVQVSGMRSPDGRPHATRIGRAPDLARSSVLGDLTVPANGPAVVEGVRVEHIPATLPASPTGQMLAIGQWDGQALKIDNALGDPLLRFAGHVDGVLLEALASGGVGGGELAACGLRVRAGRDTRVVRGRMGEVLDVRRVRILGRIGADGALEAQELDTGLPGQPAR